MVVFLLCTYVVRKAELAWEKIHCSFTSRTAQDSDSDTKYYTFLCAPFGQNKCNVKCRLFNFTDRTDSNSILHRIPRQRKRKPSGDDGGGGGSTATLTILML